MGLNIWYKRLNEMLFSTPPSLRTPPLYFALQNTGEEGEMYFFALISVKCDTMGGEIAFFFFGI